jgi:hypothetical protein
MTRAGVVLLIVLGVVSAGAPAWGEPAGLMTVAEFRAFLGKIEADYDARMGRAVATFFASGAVTQTYLLATCLRPQTVGELSAWLRHTAPPELTLLEALRLNERERGCEGRDPSDVDAELAIRAWRQRPATACACPTAPSTCSSTST